MIIWAVTMVRYTLWEQTDMVFKYGRVNGSSILSKYVYTPISDNSISQVLPSSFGDYLKRDICKHRVPTWGLPNLSRLHDVYQRTNLNVLLYENLPCFHYQHVQCVIPIDHASPHAVLSVVPAT